MWTEDLYRARVRFKGFHHNERRRLYEISKQFIQKFNSGCLIISKNGNVDLILDSNKLPSLIQSDIRPSFPLFNQLICSKRKVVFVKTKHGLHIVPESTLPIDTDQLHPHIEIKLDINMNTGNKNVTKRSNLLNRVLKPNKINRNNNKSRRLEPRSEDTTIFSLKPFKYSTAQNKFTDRSIFRIGKIDDKRSRPVLRPVDEGNFDNDLFPVQEHGRDDNIEQQPFPVQASDALDSEQVYHTYNVSENTDANLLQQEYRTRPRIETPARHPDYSTMHTRLETFLHWPHGTDVQDVNRLAQTGLYYTGTPDLVRCFHCGIGLKDWASADDPLQVHIRHSSNCEFLRATVPQSEMEVYQRLFPVANEQSDTDVDFLQHAHTHDNVPLLQPSQSRPQRYRNPTYREYDARVASFSRWPSNIVQTPQQLAEAGFFYTGMEDIVRCYACDGGLRKWDSEDDPWIEHAHWFPHCIHVIRERGQEYIDLIQVAAADDEEEDAGEQPRDMEHLYVNNNTGRESDDPIYSPPAQTAIDFGFSKAAVKMAIEECNDKYIRWKAENLINILLEKQEKGETLPTDSPRSRSPVLRRNIDSSTKNGIVEENKMLKRKLKCMLCEVEDVNVLFLPCAHHNMCTTCAADVTMCPICEKTIKEKIKTFMS